MKARAWTAAGVAGYLMCAATAGWAQHTIMLNVRQLTTKDDRVHRKEIGSAAQWNDAVEKNTTWVTAPTELDFIYASQTIEIGIKNTGTKPEKFDLEIYFLERDLTAKKDGVTWKDVVKMEVAPGGSQTITTNSPTLRYCTQDIMVNNKAQRVGFKPTGYVVALRDDKAIFKTASNRECEKIVSDAAQLSRTLGTAPRVSALDRAKEAAKKDQAK